MWQSANLIIMNMMLQMLLMIMMIDNHGSRDVYDDKLVLVLIHISFLLSPG